ncbi:hypothetical protein [Vibrio cincinnatiensis]|uniref:hypothetical protein n=1 Tax=Vibrio cincinnatiensis TaxID=675 RepID=UPI001EDEADB3|nr:hypothetical protein [Vibrio cincinnatiensis]MCG3726354.1 hypothetical protein [Vibrio cincinnatiensis]MCG3733020.1 hypothetical protein [Vibrio cincinnatiensis]MCG3735705.1 hypothetical protein [Vibrio cincinnatiensis]MCG3740421.1 hypothetical protein [Vibrio cincinnatiensis]MCG3743923.1 hypothetical protein [Vibrio cincinnatiensis]
MAMLHIAPKSKQLHWFLNILLVNPTIEGICTMPRMHQVGAIKIQLSEKLHHIGEIGKSR